MQHGEHASGQAGPTRPFTSNLYHWGKTGDNCGHNDTNGNDMR